MEKYVKVTGGYISGGTDDSETGGVFMVKKTVIVLESELGALFRKDWELCGMPKIKIQNTNERPRY